MISDLVQGPYSHTLRLFSAKNAEVPRHYPSRILQMLFSPQTLFSRYRLGQTYFSILPTLIVIIIIIIIVFRLSAA